MSLTKDVVGLTYELSRLALTDCPGKPSLYLLRSLSRKPGDKNKMLGLVCGHDEFMHGFIQFSAVSSAVELPRATGSFCPNAPMRR